MRDEGYEDLIQDAFATGCFEAIEKATCLNDRQKQLILNYYRDKRKVTEIAEDFGITRQRVYQLRNNAMDNIRRALYEGCMSQQRREKYSTKITEFTELSVRSKNALMRNRLTTPKAINEYIKKCDMDPEHAIMKLRNIGVKSAREIEGFIIAHRMD